MKKSLYVLFALVIAAALVLAACGGGGGKPASTEPVEIRWYVGLGNGSETDQIPRQQVVVDEFNATHPHIKLVMEAVTNEAARDTLATQIASGSGPDVVGPVGWSGTNTFVGQWLDIAPYIQEANFDTSIFDPELVKSYMIPAEGQVGLPFAVFPAGVFFRPELFDEAGLAYPPQKYGEKYVLDGVEVDWNYDTLAEVAKHLTVDKNGFNAKSPDFDRNNIVQVGFDFQWQTDLYYIPSYMTGGAQVYSGNTKGEFKATLPDRWKEAIKWYYDGMYGPEPFIASGPLQSAAEFGNGNIFSSGKLAMGISPSWYTCCLGEFVDAGYEFQIGILPAGPDGKPHGRVDADTFRIWKGTKHPKEAVEVMTYLITTGADKLLLIYGGMPAIPEKMGPYFADLSEQYPFVTDVSWDVLKAGLSYPDVPSAEQYQPNWNEAWTRQKTFTDLLMNTTPDKLNFDAEYDKLLSDLDVIYNK